MTHDELLARLLVTDKTNMTLEVIKWQSALYAVVGLHKPFMVKDEVLCDGCCQDVYLTEYPCPTIQAITDNLK